MFRLELITGEILRLIDPSDRFQVLSRVHEQSDRGTKLFGMREKSWQKLSVVRALPAGLPHRLS